MRFRIKKVVEEEAPKTTKAKRRVLFVVLPIAFVLGAALVVGNQLRRTKAAEYTGSINLKKDACKLFSLKDAKQLLGNDATASNNNANAVSSRATGSFKGAAVASVGGRSAAGVEGI